MASGSVTHSPGPQMEQPSSGASGQGIVAPTGAGEDSTGARVAGAGVEPIGAVVGATGMEDMHAQVSATNSGRIAPFERG